MAAKPRDGRDAAFLRLFRMLAPREQRAFTDAVSRAGDGQRFDESMIEMFVELGIPRAEARRRVSKALHARPDWRKRLD
jgi:hypothetical protein